MKRLLFLILFLIFSQSANGQSFCTFALLALRAPELTEFVDLKKPLTLVDAVGYAFSSLPEGPLKMRFSKSVLTNLANVKWKAKVPKSQREVLTQIFTAVELVIEPDFVPIRRFGVYLHGRQSYIDEFLNQGAFLLQVQDAALLKYEGDVFLSSETKARVLYQRFKNLFKNLFWLREFHILRNIGLTLNFHEIIETKDESLLKDLLARRYGPDISIQWYLTHLRNIQTAGTVALLAILIPQISGAYFHESMLEKLEMAQVDNTNFKNAQFILAKSEMELKDMIHKLLASPQKQNLTPAELQFLKDLENEEINQETNRSRNAPDE